MIFASLFKHYEKALQERYEISTSIWHKGERGRQRENGLRMFLRETLPAAYGVATGEIIPFVGPKPSPQCDIIVYDRLRMPIFGSNDDVQQVPLEAVYAVIETKSTIDSKALKDAKKKLSAIMNLPRCETKPPVQDGFTRRPLLMLFGYRLRASTKSCLDFMKAFSDLKNGHVLGLDVGQGLWLSDREEPVWVNTSAPKENYHETLMFFFVLLMSELQTIDLGNPNYLKYMGDE